MTASPSAIGVTVKSGWASVVLIAGPASAPTVLDSRRIALSDPSIADARQPYHAGFGTARGAGPELRRLVGSVKRFGSRSVTRVIRDFRGAGHDLRGAGIVAGSLIDPARIANDHIRIHAMEGLLFRTVVVNAAARADLPCSVWRDKELYALAAKQLRRPEAALRASLTAMGRNTAGGWRAEQKSAALAAWLVLAARQPDGSA